MNAWSNDVSKLLGLVDECTHLINKVFDFIVANNISQYNATILMFLIFDCLVNLWLNFGVCFTSAHMCRKKCCIRWCQHSSFWTIWHLMIFFCALLMHWYNFEQILRQIFLYTCGILWRGLCGTFEEGCVILWSGWCGALKMVVWHYSGITHT